MRRLWVHTIAGVLFIAAAAPGQSSEPEMQKPFELSAAGLELAVPKDFSPVPVADMYQLFQATRTDADGKVIQGITLSAYPVDGTVAADQYADQMVAQMKQSLVVRDLELVKRTDLTVAKLPGTARLLRYTWRGRPTVAAGAFFIREDKPTATRICYVITVECAEAYKSSLLRVFGALVKSVRLIALQHACKADAGPAGALWSDPRGLFTLRAPLGWHISAVAGGATMGRVDYLYGGIPTAALQVQVVGSLPGDSPQGMSDKQLERMKQFALRSDMTIQVVSQGPAKLSGQPAHEFVITQSPRQSDPSAELPEDATIVCRTICVEPTPQELTGACYSLVLVCQGTSTHQAKSLMESLAKGFEATSPAQADDAPDPQPSPADPAIPPTPTPAEPNAPADAAPSQRP